jgi:hypothetical protein
MHRTDPLLLCSESLSRALEADVPGRELDWAEAAEQALDRLELALKQHRAAANAPDGLLAEVDETRPTLARSAEGLRAEHDQFLAKIAAFHEEVKQAAEAFRPGPSSSARTAVASLVDFTALRRRGQEILANVQKHRQAETNLVLDSVNTDIGTGD